MGILPIPCGRCNSDGCPMIGGGSIGPPCCGGIPCNDGPPGNGGMLGLGCGGIPCGGGGMA